MKIIFIISLNLLLLSSSLEASNVSGGNRASLQGSRKSLLSQNKAVNNERLTRIKNKAQLKLFINQGLLVSIQKIENVNIDYRLRDSLSYVRPNTALFLENLAAAYYKIFGLYIQINSAVRTIEDQNNLRKTNTNAAPAMLSSHTTGSSIDVSYMDMTDQQKMWVRSYLLRCESRGYIEATEERSQTVFHIMVFKNYNLTTKKPYAQ